MKLGLGTVQFGMPYGIVNSAGKVPAEEARRIVELARTAGMRVFDTAAAYGEAESVLGACLPDDESLRIVTRLPPLPGEIASWAIESWVEAAIASSLRRLRRDRVAGLLVHRIADLLGEHGSALYECLSGLRRRGDVGAIGASVYEPAEIDALMERFPPDLVQVPLNLLDQRLIHGGQLRRLKQLGAEVHGRSLLLQGLLAARNGEPSSDYFKPWRPLLKSFRDAAGREGLSPLQAAIGFAGTVPEIDCAVIGVTSAAELKEVLDAASTHLPPEWYGRFAVNDARLVNPARWPS